jgi:hypothetical protein
MLRWQNFSAGRSLLKGLVKNSLNHNSVGTNYVNEWVTMSSFRQTLKLNVKQIPFIPTLLI